MFNHHTLAILKTLGPLGQTLCIGHPELHGNTRSPDQYADNLLRSLGATGLAILDVRHDGGTSLYHNLNEPFLGKKLFDTVIDSGTMEHVPNIGEALRTYHKLVKPGGTLVMETKMDGNLWHGFYQLSPVLFYTVFVRNGYDVVCYSHRLGPWSRLRIEPNVQDQRECWGPPQEIIAVCKKVHELPWLWPLQPAFEPQGAHARASAHHRTHPPQLKLAWDCLKEFFKRCL